MNTFAISVTASFIVALFAIAWLLFILLKEKKNKGQLSVEAKKHIDSLKYEFITVITHKFRTPLAQIKWGAEALRSAPTETAKELEYRKIERSIATIYAMTDVLLKVASAETSGIDLSLESVVLPLFVREIANEMQEDFMRKKIEIDFVQITQVPPVLLDKKQIKLVILTLLHNAVFYSTDDAKIRVAFREEKGYVIVEIIDNGIGIEKNELSKVFERFYRGDAAREVDQQGLGIGLYMSRKIVGLHNGSLTLYSEGKGKGTAALLALPERQNPTVPTPATSSTEETTSPETTN